MSQELLDQVRNDYKQLLPDPKKSILTGDPDRCTMSASVGYTPEELALVPTEANLGLGCGNPLRAANLQPGENPCNTAKPAPFRVPVRYFRYSSIISRLKPQLATTPATIPPSVWHKMATPVR